MINLNFIILPFKSPTNPLTFNMRYLHIFLNFFQPNINFPLKRKTIYKKNTAIFLLKIIMIFYNLY